MGTLLYLLYGVQVMVSLTVNGNSLKTDNHTIPLKTCCTILLVDGAGVAIMNPRIDFLHEDFRKEPEIDPS